MEEFDVVIAGGGPGGVIAAIMIAKAGYSVVIVDRKKMDQIGHKNCGDALDATQYDLKIRDILGIASPHGDELRSHIQKITIAAGGLDSKITAVLSPGYQVDRLVFGQRLLKSAIEAGAKVYDQCTITDVLIENDYATGIRYSHRERGKQELRSKITIDATGYTAKIRKAIPESMRYGIDLEVPDHYTIATYREIIRFKDGKKHNFQNEITWLYERAIEPPGYIWIFTEGDDMLNIGICWIKSIPYPDGMSLKELYHKFLDPYFNPSTYEVIYGGGGNIPMRPSFDSVVFNGVMITGDAGAHADPTTFEGHGPALETSMLAAEAAIHALEVGKYDYATMWSYNKKVMDYLGRIHAESFATANFMKDIGIDNLAYLIDKKVISEEELVTLYKDPEAQMTLGVKLKKLRQGFPRLGLMYKLSKIIALIDKIDDHYYKYPETPDGLQEWIVKRDKIFTI